MPRGKKRPNYKENSDSDDSFVETAKKSKKVVKIQDKKKKIIKKEDSSFSNDDKSFSESEISLENEKSIQDQSIESIKSLKKQNKRKNKRSKSKDSQQKSKSQSPNKKNEETKIKGVLENQHNEDAQIDELTLPYFLQKQNIQDINHRRPDDEEYDKTTIYIPQSELDQMTGTLKQFWSVKQVHFDKVVCFKIWKFYYTWYEDALNVAKYSDFNLKNVSWCKQATCFFHESCLPKVVNALVKNNLKIVVVEQMEEKNMDTKNVMQRDIIQVISKGTHVDFGESEFDMRNIISIVQIDDKLGFVVIDITTRQFYFGEFFNDEFQNNLKNLNSKVKPLEIVYMKKYLEKNNLQFFKNIKIKPTLSNMNQSLQDYQTIKTKICSYFKELPQIIQQIFDVIDNCNQQQLKNFSDIPYFATLQSFYLLISYLESIILDQTVIRYGNYNYYDDKNRNFLFLDSQALQNLEILESNSILQNQKNNSFFEYIDNTKTLFGKRKLQNWLLNPLADINKIQERVDQVEDIANNHQFLDSLQTQLNQLSDLERKMYRVTGVSEKRLQAVYFRDFQTEKIQDFKEFLNETKQVQSIIENLQKFKKDLKSERVIKLITFQDQGLFPKLNEQIEEIEKMVFYRNGLPTPQEGLDPIYDNYIEEIQLIEQELRNYLQQLKKELKIDSLKYVHAKFQYQIEIPKEYDRPKDFHMTFSLLIKDLKEKDLQDVILLLSIKNQEKFMNMNFYAKIELNRLFQFILKNFWKKNNIGNKWQFFNQKISCLSELDCLASLAKLSHQMKVKCKPNFIKSNTTIFNLQQMVHPCIQKLKQNFIPNDIIFQNQEKIMLMTGPNMGGKSTTLRQSCLAIILAQMGSFVPANYFELTPIDRIFTRIGAYDNIFDSKSTFYMEMEETKIFLNEATQNSFAIIDELGRGTSTFDGMAIAYAVLKNICQNIKCFTMFTTHYHNLVQEFQSQEYLVNKYMGFKKENQQIQFLFKLMNGYCPESFGLNVASMAGIPNQIIQIASYKSQTILKIENDAKDVNLINDKFQKSLSNLFNISVQ